MTAGPAALVTGASSGLGRAIAMELAEAGRPLLLLGRDADRLAEAAAEVARRGADARVVAADVRDAAALTSAITEGLRKAPLGFVVNAAGVLEIAPVDGAGDDDFRRCLETNVLGTAHVVRATLPHLAAARGHLVLVASIAGRLALPGGFGAYGASKWAVRGHAETIRAELRARGVGLTVAYPSILDTPMVRQLGREAPAVYRAFPWHAPERAARAIVRDARRGRRESYTSLSDRLAAAVAGAFPATFARALELLVRLGGSATDEHSR